MSNITNHTPTPWMLGRGSLIEIFAVDPDNPDSVDSTDTLHVATVQRRGAKSVLQRHADAAFIVRACNSHEQLVAAVRGSHAAIDRLMARLIQLDPTFMPSQSGIYPVLKANGDALAAAET